jgi:hypothetical protein
LRTQGSRRSGGIESPAQDSSGCGRDCEGNALEPSVSRRDYWTSRCCVTQAVLTAPGSCLECRIRMAIPNPTITATTAIAVHSMRSSRVLSVRSDCITLNCRPECQRSGGRARGQGRRVDTAWEGARLRPGGSRDFIRVEPAAARVYPGFSVRFARTATAITSSAGSTGFAKCIWKPL